MPTNGWINNGLTYVEFSSSVSNLQATYNNFHALLNGDVQSDDTYYETEEQLNSFLLKETWYEVANNNSFKHRVGNPAHITYDEVIIEEDPLVPITRDTWFYASVLIEFYEYNQLSRPPSSTYTPSLKSNPALITYVNSVGEVDPDLEPEPDLDPSIVLPTTAYSRTRTSSLFYYRGSDLNKSNLTFFEFYDAPDYNLREIDNGNVYVDHDLLFFYDDYITDKTNPIYGSSLLFKQQIRSGSSYSVTRYYPTSNLKSDYNSRNGGGISYKDGAGSSEWHDVSPSGSVPKSLNYYDFGELHYPTHSFDAEGFPNDEIAGSMSYNEDGTIYSKSYYNLGTLLVIRDGDGNITYPL